MNVQPLAAVEIGSGTISAIGSLILSVGGVGVLLKFFTIKQDRRKIAGEASTEEANAASTLSGAALQMVEQYQKQAAEAVKGEAGAKLQVSQLWDELNRERWRGYAKDVRMSLLEKLLADAKIVPPPLDEALLQPPGVTGPPPDMPPDAMVQAPAPGLPPA